MNKLYIIIPPPHSIQNEGHKNRLPLIAVPWIFILHGCRCTCQWIRENEKDIRKDKLKVVNEMIWT